MTAIASNGRATHDSFLTAADAMESGGGTNGTVGLEETNPDPHAPQAQDNSEQSLGEEQEAGEDAPYF